MTATPNNEMEDWTVTLTEILPNCPNVQAAFEKLATPTQWDKWRPPSPLRSAKERTTIVSSSTADSTNTNKTDGATHSASEPLSCGDEFVVHVDPWMKVVCRVVESSAPLSQEHKTKKSDATTRVYATTARALGGLVQAHIRFTVSSIFGAQPGREVVQVTVQERIQSPVPCLLPSRAVLQHEHEHTLHHLNASFVA